MLMSLSLRHPDVLEYHELMEHLGLDLDSARNTTLETFGSRLRHKLVPIDRKYLTIKTIRNIGYQLSSGLTIRT
jgi:DNA-binding response OmpR family regulator